MPEPSETDKQSEEMNSKRLKNNKVTEDLNNELIQKPVKITGQTVRGRYFGLPLLV